MIQDYLGKELNIGDKVLYCGENKRFFKKVVRDFKSEVRYNITTNLIGISDNTESNRIGYTHSYRLIKIDW